jgi:hypothetical protein
MAQSACEINDVHTNPDPQYVKPVAASAAEPYHTNQFDWIRRWWPIAWQNVPMGSVDPPPPKDANYMHIISPFYSNDLDLRYFAKHASSDFQPRDGWELVAYDFGMEYNSETTVRPSNDFSEGYLILYNKHTSTLRALVTPLAVNGAVNMAEMRWRLEPRIDDHASGLFAGTGGLLNPLDQPSPTREVSTRFSHPPNMPGRWFLGDVPVFYDPCSCTRDQRLETRHFVITSGEIKLYGLYAGTVQTLDAASDGQSVPYQSGVIQDPEAYLASLDAQDESDLRPGAIVAKNKDALAQSYDLWVNERNNRNTGSLLPGIFDGLAIAGDAAGLFSETAMLGGIPVSKLFKAVGVGSKLFSKLLKPSDDGVDPENYLPSYMQGEISLRGSYTETSDQTTNNQNIALPGTPWTKDDNQVAPFRTATKLQYPLYNETLGLFAILHAPKVKRRIGQKNIRLSLNPPGLRHFLIGSWRQFQFDGELDYVWNPASNVDVENTRIHAALIVEQEHHEVTLGANVTETTVTNGERQYDSDVVDDVAESSVFSTEFVGLECLSELPLSLYRQGVHYDYLPIGPLPDFYRGDDTVYIRLVMDVRFKPNEYGVRNRSTIIYTLPVEFVEEEDTLVGNGMPAYDENLTVGSITHTNPYEVFVHSTITINGEVKTNPTTNNASYVAGEEIIVQSGATIGMNTRLALDFGTPCGKPRIAPYSGDINAFCTSGQYKAKEIADAVIAGDEHSDPFENWSKDHQLRARLETGQQQLVVVSESTEDPMVVVQVYDVIGNLVATGQGYESAEPLTRTTVPMNGVPAGAYVVIATSGGRSATFKILYAP